MQARTVTVISHARTQQVAPALEALMRAARAEGVTLRFDPDETEKYALQPGDGLALDAPVSDDVDVCVVLGGDGTILRALRREGDVADGLTPERRVADDAALPHSLAADLELRLDHRQAVELRRAGAQHGRQHLAQ